MTEKEVALKAVFQAVKFCEGVQNNLVKNAAVMKADRSPVTIADFGAQAIISRILSESLPGIGIMAEERSLDLLKGANPELPRILKKSINDIFDPEAGIQDICRWIDCDHKANSERYWVLDPIDGTKGFLRGEQYAVALALIAKGEVILGLLGCPGMQYDAERKGCIFMAERGKGARQLWLGDLDVNKDISVSYEKDGHLMKFVESVEKEHADHNFHGQLCKTLGIECKPERLDSQAKYGIVARGDASAYLRLPSPEHPDYKQKIWDHAAGSIIIEEAGGKVTDIFGKSLDFTQGETLKSNSGIIATNGKCHDMLIETIRHIMAEEKGPAKW